MYSSDSSATRYARTARIFEGQVLAPNVEEDNRMNPHDWIGNFSVMTNE